MPAAQRLFFEDLPVGTRFESAPVTVSATDIKRFAGEYDPQPFHLDEQAAHATFFSGLAASGWHTTALTMWLVVARVRMKVETLTQRGDAVQVMIPNMFVPLRAPSA